MHANNEGADQPVHQRSPISALVICVLLVEEPGLKNVKNEHLGMPPF